MYASTTHWASTIVAWSSRWSAGSTTLTTVPSMNAMLDPRIVAASTHGAAARPQGEEAPAARACASSQGARTKLDMEGD